MKCPVCGKFVSNVECTYFGEDGEETISEVWGFCKTHFKVSLTNESMTAAAKYVGVNVNSIHRIVNGKFNSCKGYQFNYSNQ